MNAGRDEMVLGEKIITISTVQVYFWCVTGIATTKETERERWIFVGKKNREMDVCFGLDWGQHDGHASIGAYGYHYTHTQITPFYDKMNKSFMF